MKKKKTHMDDETQIIAELKAHPAFAAEYLKGALEDAHDETGRAILLTALRRVAKAQGIATVARKAGLTRESLSRALSEKGNPRFDTLYSALNAMGLKITVQKHRPSAH